MRRPEDAGFTLIELVVATAIMGIVAVTISGAMSTVFINSASTTVRMTQTHDAQSIASFFTQDASSAGVRDWAANSRPLKPSIEQNVAYNAGSNPCGAAGTPNAIVRMAWDDFDPANTANVKLDTVAYVPWATGPGATLQMHRLVCQKTVRISDGSVLSSSTTDHVVVRALGPGASALCTDKAGLAVACTSTAPLPASVALTLTVHDQRMGEPDLALALSGHPRQS